MRTFFFYIRILINYFRYKVVFKKSSKFLIDHGSAILGGNMMIIGKSFAAKKDLRMEAFGNDGKTRIEIGNNVSFGERVHIGAMSAIVFGDNVLLGSNILIIDHNHGNYTGLNQSSPLEAPAKRILQSSGPIIIERNVWIGDGVVVLPNVKIGEGAVIAANSVVNKNVEPNTIVGGNPVRILKQYDFRIGKWETVN